MTCAEAERHFLAHEQGEATPEGFAEHLGSCGQCREALEGFSGAGAALRALRPAPVATGFADAVAARVATLARRPRVWPIRPLSAVALAAVAVVVVALVGVRLLVPRGGSPGALPLASAPTSPAAPRTTALVEPGAEPPQAPPAPAEGSAGRFQTTRA
jgi:hypothetical protein